MSVKLGSSLPRDDRNGIGAISASLVDNPGAMHVIVAIVRGKTITIDVDTGDEVPTARIMAIEAFEGKSAIGQQLREILRQQYSQRTGHNELPFEEKPEPADDDD